MLGCIGGCLGVVLLIFGCLAIVGGFLRLGFGIVFGVIRGILGIVMGLVRVILP